MITTASCAPPHSAELGKCDMRIALIGVLIALLMGSPAYAGDGVDSPYVPPDYKQVFGDEFSTANLDTTK
jgi:hypothetical protein